MQQNHRSLVRGYSTPQLPVSVLISRNTAVHRGRRDVPANPRSFYMRQAKAIGTGGGGGGVIIGIVIVVVIVIVTITITILTIITITITITTTITTTITITTSSSSSSRTRAGWRGGSRGSHRGAADGSVCQSPNSSTLSLDAAVSARWAASASRLLAIDRPPRPGRPFGAAAVACMSDIHKVA